MRVSIERLWCEVCAEGEIELIILEATDVAFRLLISVQNRFVVIIPMVPPLTNTGPPSTFACQSKVSLVVQTPRQLGDRLSPHFSVKLRIFIRYIRAGKRGR
jgi:hypothetical protein